MSWTLLIGLVLALTLAVLVALFRQSELRRQEHRIRERADARTRGSGKARLAYPHVDLSRCLGCGACVRACPEEGVLALIHGQALVVHGARCVGHGLCAQECPTGAIVVAFDEVETRRDLPVIDARFEVPAKRGLFLGGEVTGYALIRTAIAHGTAIAAEVARRIAAEGPAQEAYDLCIVGAGPGGIACALEATARKLRFLVLEQDSLGGTVAKYPRQKLVLTQPVELPLWGTLEKRSYQKEELIALWEQVTDEHQLPVQVGVRLQGVSQGKDGCFTVQTDRGSLHARNVALMLGRRGTPRRLEVPGEELPKVVYALLDAQSYQGQHILVVGGGDSAIEAALALADQRANQVTLSYRQAHFSRLKPQNEERIAQAAADGRVRVLFRSVVERITPTHVELALDDQQGTRRGALPNDAVFVLIGGTPPFELLERCGVSFDPADRPPGERPVERGTGLLRALSLALAVSLMGLAWIGRYSDYYTLPAALRPFASQHDWLRPSSRFGLVLGCASAGLIAINLLYLARRHAWFGLRRGSLKAWMTAHVLTGVLALLFAVLHGGMSTQDTLGHRALLALAIVVVTGTIGRYVYSFVPRAANGRELELDELKSELAALSGEWEREHREFGARAQALLEAQTSRMDGQRSFWTRLAGLFGASRGLRAALRSLREEGEASGLPPDQLERLLALARRAQRTASMAAHFEDLRALISSWRYMHRWVALFLVLLVALHVLVALRYGSLVP